MFEISNCSLLKIWNQLFRERTASKKICLFVHQLGFKLLSWFLTEVNYLTYLILWEVSVWCGFCTFCHLLAMHLCYSFLENDVYMIKINKFTVINLLVYHVQNVHVYRHFYHHNHLVKSFNKLKLKSQGNYLQMYKTYLD